MDCTPAFRPCVVWLDLIEEIDLIVIVALSHCGSIHAAWLLANWSHVLGVEAVAVRTLLLEGILMLTG